MILYVVFNFELSWIKVQSLSHVHFIYHKIAYNVCYKGPIRNNIFVIFIINKGKIVYDRPFKTHFNKWKLVNRIGVLKLWNSVEKLTICRSVAHRTGKVSAAIHYQ